MKINFIYDIDKDAENFIKTSKSKNNSSLTESQKEFVIEYGDDFEVDKVKKFLADRIKNQHVDITKELKNVEKEWLLIEGECIPRIEKIFDSAYPYPEITVYLTNNERCGYNLRSNYFFVGIGSTSSNRTIMHELFHFYTWFAFGDIGNDLKESLTEILNIEFSDLMKGSVDYGYPQHKEIRQEVAKLWKDKDDLKQVVKIITERQIHDKL